MCRSLFPSYFLIRRSSFANSRWGGNEWTFQFRFWPNNNNRMYVLIACCVTFSQKDPGGKLVMGFRKASSLETQFWISTNALLSPKGVNFEVQASMGIKESLVDPHGVLENWDGDVVDLCSWNMVTCSLENLVIGLVTPSQNLFGTLSASIGNLTNLQIVLLQNNNITGPLPSELIILDQVC
ncbi:hypothetical protein L6164_001158 [Bauhinia variegata]|uniref:Uncharacterized protein n=1 Tax=Bauhinia variegata TaxID=167791 RepID=A0ACB9Q874_BAUVA|nr:hypothetical protein L6164_001158 [Bauhinia variegata]